MANSYCESEACMVIATPSGKCSATPRPQSTSPPMATDAVVADQNTKNPAPATASVVNINGTRGIRVAARPPTSRPAIMPPSTAEIPIAASPADNPVWARSCTGTHSRSVISTDMAASRHPHANQYRRGRRPCKARVATVTCRPRRDNDSHHGHRASEHDGSTHRHPPAKTSLHRQVQQKRCHKPHPGGNGVGLAHRGAARRAVVGGQPVDTPLSTRMPNIIVTAAATRVPVTDGARQNMATPAAIPVRPMDSTEPSDIRRVRCGREDPADHGTHRLRRPVQTRDRVADTRLLAEQQDRRAEPELEVAEGALLRVMQPGDAISYEMVVHSGAGSHGSPSAGSAATAASRPEWAARLPERCHGHGRYASVNAQAGAGTTGRLRFGRGLGTGSPVR